MGIVDYAMRVHDFMRSNRPLDEAGRKELHELATHEKEGPNCQDSASFCLRSACTYAQPDKAAILIDEYGADIQQYHKLGSDLHPGHVILNLLDETLSSYRIRPDVDRSPAGQTRLAEMVELLLQKGVSASPNSDPFENPVLDASRLAHPDRASDENSPEFDWITSIGDDGDELPRPFREPYDLIRKYQPEAVTAYEGAVKAARPEQETTSSKLSKAASGEKPVAPKTPPSKPSGGGFF